MDAKLELMPLKVIIARVRYTIHTRSIEHPHNINFYMIKFIHQIAIKYVIYLVLNQKKAWQINKNPCAPPLPNIVNGYQTPPCAKGTLELGGANNFNYTLDRLTLIFLHTFFMAMMKPINLPKPYHNYQTHDYVSIWLATLHPIGTLVIQLQHNMMDPFITFNVKPHTKTMIVWSTRLLLNMITLTDDLLILRFTINGWIGYGNHCGSHMPNSRIPIWPW